MMAEGRLEGRLLNSLLGGLSFVTTIDNEGLSSMTDRRIRGCVWGNETWFPHSSSLQVST